MWESLGSYQGKHWNAILLLYCTLARLVPNENFFLLLFLDVIFFFKVEMFQPSF